MRRVSEANPIAMDELRSRVVDDASTRTAIAALVERLVRR